MGVQSPEFGGGDVTQAHERELETTLGGAQLEQEVAPGKPRFSAAGTIPPVAVAGARPHHPTASERAFGHPSTAQPGRTVDLDVGALVGTSTDLDPALLTLVRAMQAKHLSAGASESGLEKLEQVFEDPHNAARLMAATHTHDSQHLMAWLHHHETGIIPTREHAPGGLASRTPQALEADLAGFLHDHAGAHAMIDEAGTKRFGLVAEAARDMAHDHPEDRGRWGSYFSAAPGGLHTAKVRHTMAELRDAGASAVLEGYTAGKNSWQDETKRLHRDQVSLGLMRHYFAHPGVAIGADPLRVGLPDDHGKAHHRVFLLRLREALRRAHHALPGVPLGTWISRLDGNAHADNAELGSLLGAM